ncbi:unnamed protein product [Peniophora sp. CBMAI 1063]|nr:unnamed protein product [Peniophora sp. CBMAI 1063]
MPPNAFTAGPSGALDKRTTFYGLFGNVSDGVAAIAANDMDVILQDGYMSVVMSILFTFLSIVFFTALRHLLKDGLRSRPNKWMLAALTIMYGCATVSYAFELLTFSQDVKFTTEDFTGRYDTSNSNIASIASIGQYVIQGVSVLCGDLVILWRTGVVWHNSTVIRRLNLLFLILVILTWIAGIAILAMFGIQFALIPLALSLSINLWSTGAIGYKTWHRRNMLRRQIFMAGRSSGSAVEGALAVLTETGIAYTVLWIIYVAVVASFFFGPRSFDDVALDQGFQWFWIIMNMLIPLYPTLLILLIARRITPLTETLTSIDASTVDSSPTSSIVDVIPLQETSRPDDKIGDDLYDPYVAITGSSSSSAGTPRGSFRLEPNRRG